MLRQVSEPVLNPIPNKGLGAIVNFPDIANRYTR